MFSGRRHTIAGGLDDVVSRMQAAVSLGLLAARRSYQKLGSFAERAVLFAVGARNGDIPVAVANATVAPVVSLQLTAADQWSKISAILMQSVDGARATNEMQSVATQQLDLAQYGLITLVDELSAVMTLPGRRSRSATVHAFGGHHDAAISIGGGSHALAA